MKECIELNEKIIKGGYCVGCGNCVFASKNFKMKMTNDGQLSSEMIDEEDDKSKVLNLCPFYNAKDNESKISQNLYGQQTGIKRNNWIGYYLDTFAGYVKTSSYRQNGSSGGFGSWIASKMLEIGMVDKVIHVKSSNKRNRLFEYSVSSSVAEINEGSKSKYYPVEMSEVLEFVKNNDFNYLIIGIPCFIKAIRLLQLEDSDFKKRIRFTLGLVCGHLKSDFFAKSIGWELGIHPKDLVEIDFRVKSNERANNYNIKVTGYINNQLVSKEETTNKLFVSNWGHGLFKYKACDYCDDVLAETADITIGDAWLPEYTNDANGTNVIIVRNRILLDLIYKFHEEINISTITPEKVYLSQKGGFNHRREGLFYRMKIDDENGVWHPQKRWFYDNLQLTSNRKKIYKQRIVLREQSFRGFHKSINDKSFDSFISYLKPILTKYDRLYDANSIRASLRRLMNYVKKIFSLH